MAVLYAASNRLTAKDFFAKREHLPKPEVARRDWGFVVGGPVVRNRAHFFFSLERQVRDTAGNEVRPHHVWWQEELNVRGVSVSGWTQHSCAGQTLDTSGLTPAF